MPECPLDEKRCYKIDPYRKGYYGDREMNTKCRHGEFRKRCPAQVKYGWFFEKLRGSGGKANATE